jgi:hypothetical protein
LYFQNKMKRTVTKEIVQHQGWLFKRGEGYEGDDAIGGGNNASGNTGGTSATSPTNSNTLKAKGFFKDGMKQVKGAGSGIIMAQRNGTLTKGEDLNTDMLLGSLERLIRGKGEKRRYFKLVTMEERLAPGQDNSFSNPSMSMSNSRGARPSDLYNMKVELRYYSKESADPGSLKGVISLSADCELVTKSDDANFKLITPGRCYYLRPDGDASSVTSRTIAYQWSDTIRREIRSLWALHQVFSRQASNLNMNSGSEGAPNSPSMNPRSRFLRAESALVTEPESIPSTLAEVLANPKTRSDFRDFLETALASENLQFYEEVERLPLAQDMKKRGQEIIDEYVVPGSPKEVNVSSHQRNALLNSRENPRVADFADAKAEVFKLMEDNFFKRFYREAMEKTGAFAALYATLGIDGFNAVIQHFGPVKTDLARTLLTFQSRLKRAEGTIEQIKRELSSSSRDVSVAHQTTSKRAMIAAYHVTVARLEALTDYADEMRNQVVQPLENLAKKIEHDILTIHSSVHGQVTDLEECKKLIQGAKADLERAKQSNAPNQNELRMTVVDCEVALENAESVHSKPIEAAMAKLESLELYRIETQKQIVRYAMLAEKNMLQELQNAAELMSVATKGVTVDNDIKELTLGMENELQIF